MIFDCISDNIPPQMKILNMVISILMHFYNLVSNWSVASRKKPHKAYVMKCDVINDVKLFPTVYCRIYCRKFLTLSNQTSRCKSKCIRSSVYTHYYLEVWIIKVKMDKIRNEYNQVPHLTTNTTWESDKPQFNITNESQESFIN